MKYVYNIDAYRVGNDSTDSWIGSVNTKGVISHSPDDGYDLTDISDAYFILGLAIENNPQLFEPNSKFNIRINKVAIIDDMSEVIVGYLTSIAILNTNLEE